MAGVQVDAGIEVVVDAEVEAPVYALVKVGLRG